MSVCRHMKYNSLVNKPKQPNIIKFLTIFPLHWVSYAFNLSNIEL